MEQIEARVKRVIVEKLGIEESKLSEGQGDSFVNDLGADSLDIVELVMALEEEFEMQIPDEEAEKITTVKEAIEYIKNAHLNNPHN